MLHSTSIRAHRDVHNGTAPSKVRRTRSHGECDGDTRSIVAVPKGTHLSVTT